ncbi:MAG: hypothetical protein JW874_11675 [Spirochaetales bacterium]|nr:hypothetical protein [Spirochaetales bacterium]
MSYSLAFSQAIAIMISIGAQVRFRKAGMKVLHSFRTAEQKMKEALAAVRLSELFRLRD